MKPLRFTNLPAAGLFLDSAPAIGRAMQPLRIDMGGPSDPMKRMRETVAALRRMFEGRTNPKLSGRQPIFLAGVAPPMVRLAGEIAEGVICNFFPPERVKAALGELQAGAQKAGRDVKEVVPALFATAFISNDVEAAPCPHPALTLRRHALLREHAGGSGFAREMSGIRSAGDPKAALAAVSDTMIDATLLVGPEERVREHLQELTRQVLDGRSYSSILSTKIG